MSEYEFEIGADPVGAKLLCDGQEMHGVTSINVHAEVGKMTRLTVEYLPIKMRLRLNEPELLRIDPDPPSYYEWAREQ